MKYSWKIFLLLMCFAMLTACKSDERYQKIELAPEGSNAESSAVHIQIDADDGGSTWLREDEPDLIIAGEPEETHEETEQSNAKESVSLLFGGDVFLSSHVLSAYDRAGGIGGVLDEGYRTAIDGADLFFVNQEFPISSRGTAAEDKQYTFRLPPERVSVLNEMGVDAVALANNHALDYGTEALLDTCGILNAAGIGYTGAGENLEQAKEPLSFEKNGVRVAVVAASRVFPEAFWAAGKNHPGMLSAYVPEVMLAEITEAKKRHDYVVAYVHWGVERDEQPQEYQRQLGRRMIDAGADLVVGAHPHVLQGVEYYNGKPVVYSLGNFVFGSSIPRTALLRVTLDKTEGADALPQARLEFLPGTSAAGYTRMYTEETKQQEFYQYMERISFGVSFDGGMAKETLQ